MKKTHSAGIIAAASVLISVLSLSLVLPLSVGATAIEEGDNVKASANIRTNGIRPLFKASSTKATSTNPELLTKIKTRADQEIDRRVESLTKLSARVSEMKKVSSSGKASIASTIQAEITTLTNLKVKIDADTDAEILKTDVKSITESYRIYALIMPQIAILVAADRVNILADDFTALNAKLQARITASATAGKDMSVATAALTDISAKAADAKTKAAAAVSGVTSLTPDNGDKAKATSNREALVAARASIKAAQESLKAARADVEIIIKATKKDNKNSTSTEPTHTP